MKMSSCAHCKFISSNGAAPHRPQCHDRDALNLFEVAHQLTAISRADHTRGQNTPSSFLSLEQFYVIGEM